MKIHGVRWMILTAIAVLLIGAFALSGAAANEASFSSLTELNDAYYPETIDYDLEPGVVAQGHITSDFELMFTGSGVTEPLTVAYVMMDKPFLYVDEASAFTIYNEGGYAPYQYTIALYWQSYTAENNIYSRISYETDLTSNVYNYTLAAAYEGRFFIQITITDSNSEYLIFRSNYYSARRANETDNTTVEGKVQSVVDSNITAGMTDYQQALTLHDWLINNATYDYTYTEYYPDGVLLKGTGVCQSYALAYQIFLTKIGIPCLYVTGDVDSVGHGWNLVKLDGDWYHVDCTWDDPGTGGYERHTYFCLTDEMMSDTHVWGSESERLYDSYMPACTATYYNYEYIRTNVPLLTSITLSSTSLNLEVGDEQTVTAETVPATSRHHALGWASGNETAVYVNTSGEITALAEGSSAVTCSESNGGHPVQCLVTVTNSTLPFAVGNPSSPGNSVAGSEITTTVNVTGGAGSYAYNWYLFRYIPDGAYAVIQMSNVGVLEGSWTFDLPDIEGTYCIRVIATDGTNVNYADSDWFYVYQGTFTVGKPTSPGNVPEGTDFTTTVQVTGGNSAYGCAYNFYLFHSSGAIAQQMIGVFDNSWDLTFAIQVSDAEQGLGSIYLIRVIATDGTNVAYADTDWFYVYPDEGGTLRSIPVILNQPTDQTVGVGTPATFSVEAAGYEPLTYQWYVNTNTGIGWKALVGETADTYTTDAVTQAADGFRYYCRVTDAGDASVDSDVAVLTVITQPQTGDDSHPGWLIILSVLAAAGIVLVLLHKKNLFGNKR